MGGPLTLAAIVLAAAVYDCPTALGSGATMLWQGCQAPVSGLLYPMGHLDMDDAADRAARAGAAVLRECAAELEAVKGATDTTWIAAGVGLLVGAGLAVAFDVWRE